MTAQRAGSKRAPAKRRELLTDLVARGLTRPAALEQRRTGLEHKRLDLHRLAPHDLGDLRVREVADLRQDDGGALILRKRAHVGEEPAEVLALQNGIR